MRWRFAASGPSSSGQIAAPPSPATSPTWTCGSRMIASSAMTITSQSSAIDAPRPTAGPFNAHTIGTSTSSMSQTICLPSRRSSFSRSGARSAGNQAMSPPAEKAEPDPVSTIARASPSTFSVANSSASSRCSVASTALRSDRGWSITTSSTSPLRSIVIVSIRPTVPIPSSASRFVRTGPRKS